MHRLFRIVLLAALFLCCPMTASTQQYSYSAHVHRYSANEREESEADRFLAMYFLTQCRVAYAKLWFERALEHDPQNLAAREGLLQMDNWAKRESSRLVMIGLTQREDDVSIFYRALSCDPSNKTAAAEVHRILASRDKHPKLTSR